MYESFLKYQYLVIFVHYVFVPLSIYLCRSHPNSNSNSYLQDDYGDHSFSSNHKYNTQQDENINTNASNMNKAHDMGGNRYKVNNDNDMNLNASINSNANVSGVGMEQMLKKFTNLEEVFMHENQQMKERMHAMEQTCDSLNSTVRIVYIYMLKLIFCVNVFLVFRVIYDYIIFICIYMHLFPFVCVLSTF